MSPDEYLEQHELTQILLRRGLTNDQLKGAAYKKNEGDEFSLWRYIAIKGWPESQIQYLPVWCALKWLVLDNPADSRDKQEAFCVVERFLTAPLCEAGQKHYQSAKNQALKSKVDRNERVIDFVEKFFQIELKKNTKTRAVEKSAKNYKISTATAWNYLKHYEVLKKHSK